MPTLMERRQELETKRGALRETLKPYVTDQKNTQGGFICDMPTDKLGEFKDQLTEIEALEESYQMHASLEQKAQNPPTPERRFDLGTGATSPTSTRKSLAEMFVEQRGYKGYQKANHNAEIEGADFKALLATSDGFAPANNRTNLVVDYPNRRPVVADLIPQDPTENSLIRYMKQTVFTNNADGVAEGGEIPESAMKWEQQDSPVRKIATWMPVTEEQLDDVAQVRAMIDRNLTLMLLLVEEEKILNGAGGASNLTGFLQLSNLQTQAKGSDNPWDAVFKAFTKVRWTGFAEPNGVIMHPNDWEPIRLTTTADGLYIWGNPAEPGTERLWGKPLIITSAISAGTALTGDFLMYSHISRKLGIRIDVSDSHSTFFVEGKLAIRIEMRESLEVYREEAFCKVTGI